MINWLAKKKVVPIRVAPGDSISITYRGPNRTETLHRPITQAGSYDTMAVGMLENELGFRDGLVAVMGNEAE